MALYRTEWLNRFSFLDITIQPELFKYTLHNLCLLRGWSSAEDVEVDVEPIVDILMDFVILGAESFWINPLFESLRFGSSPEFITSTHEEAVEASCFTKA